MILIYFLSSCLPVPFFFLSFSLFPFVFPHQRHVGNNIGSCFTGIVVEGKPEQHGTRGVTGALGEMWLIGGRLAKFICWVNGKRKALDLADGSVDMARNGLG
ncbi:hypothetical protein H0G86_000605 [Trichoderma simmonsii]|uniref:Uncharacterized protein n=1 Tax=Trichoderma simmonsii TaxID=1491479 RepID=A0A8G0KZX3_9HYPO|nr:hypothetical protein H0G86_000605 [Trichoderma simmonsii]